MSLFKPGWQSNNEHRALRSVEKLADPATLFEIAGMAPLENVRLKAVEKLNDQSLLFKLAMSDEVYNIAIAAAKKIEKQSDLDALATNAHFAGVRAGAAKKITDQKLLMDIARKDPAESVRLAAVAGLRSEENLVKIATQKNYSEVHFHAAELVRSENALLSIIMQTRDKNLAQKLVPRISDEALLLRISKSGDVLYEARAAAAKRLSVPENINDLLLNCDNVNIVSPLWNRIDGQETLVQIAKCAITSDIRHRALRQISDGAVLTDIALTDGPDTLFILMYIDDPTQLHRIFDATENEKVRQEAIRRAGGYVCKGCGRAYWPKEGDVLSCICGACGAANHAYKHVDHVTDYRDYSAGTRWDECIRCGDRINFESVYTM